MEISERLKIIRKARGLTQEKVAELAGVSYHGYQKYEYGERVPTILNQRKLCSALSIHSFLLNEECSDVKYETDKDFICWFIEQIKEGIFIVDDDQICLSPTFSFFLGLKETTLPIPDTAKEKVLCWYRLWQRDKAEADRYELKVATNLKDEKGVINMTADELKKYVEDDMAGQLAAQDLVDTEEGEDDA